MRYGYRLPIGRVFLDPATPINAREAVARRIDHARQDAAAPRPSRARARSGARSQRVRSAATARPDARACEEGVTPGSLFAACSKPRNSPEAAASPRPLVDSLAGASPSQGGPHRRVLLIEGLQKVANRITMGLILAAMIVSAAMVMRVETTFRILGYPGFASSCSCWRGSAPPTSRFRSSATIARSITGEPQAADTPKPTVFFLPRPLRRRHSYRLPPDPRHTKPKGVATAWTHPLAVLVVVAVGAALGLLHRSAQLVGRLWDRDVVRRVFAVNACRSSRRSTGLITA